MVRFVVESSLPLLVARFAPGRVPDQHRYKFMRVVTNVTLVVLIAAVLAQAQNPSDTYGTSFQGQVRYENNVPAQFIRVEMWTEGESTWRSIVETDRLGKFHAGAPCMVIQYKIEVPGFRPASGHVDMSINPCRALELITLRALPGTIIPTEAAPSSMIDPRIAAIPAEARTEFDTGGNAINHNDFAGAILHLQKAISLYPSYAEAYHLLGVAQLQTNQIPQAESSLVKAIAIEDRMPQSQYLLGVLYAKTNRVNLAEKPFSRFAELDPQNPDAHFELAKVCFALNRFPEAEMRARKSIELKETNTGVYIVLGHALLRQSKPEDARRAFQQFLQLDPNSPMATDVKATIAQIDSRAKK